MRMLALVLVAGCESFFPLVGPDAPSADSCGTEYDLGLGMSRYRFITTPAPWIAAEASCEADGAHLAVPDTQAELDTLKGQLGGRMLGSAWVGVGRDTTAAGTDKTSFRSVLGDALDPMLWQTNEPSNGRGNEYAVRISGTGLDLTDEDPNDMYTPVCECDGKPTVMPYDWE